MGIDGTRHPEDSNKKVSKDQSTNERTITVELDYYVRNKASADLLTVQPVQTE